MHCALSDSVAVSLTQDMSYMGICALCYIANCFGVVRLCSFGFILQWG